MEISELKNVLIRIDKELPNFRRVLNKLPYKSLAHKNAVEVSSFELLEKEILRLENDRRFKKDIEMIVNHIKKRNITELISALELFKEKINNVLKKTSMFEEEIIEVKPNFCGIGINVRALYRRISRGR